MFTARYGQIPYTKLFVFERSMHAITYSVRVFSVRVSESAILNFCSQLLIDNEQKFSLTFQKSFGALHFNFLVSISV